MGYCYLSGTEGFVEAHSVCLPSSGTTEVLVGFIRKPELLVGCSDPAVGSKCLAEVMKFFSVHMPSGSS